MGIYADFLTHTTVIDKTEPQVAVDRIAYNELVRLRDQFDPEVPTDFDARAEIQSIAQYTGAVTSGNFTLTITDPDGVEITTANIVYNADAATIESAIDAACSGEIDGWSNGDISVSGGDLTSADVTLTFDGNSVTEQNFGLTAINDVDLDADERGDVTITQKGQQKRYAWAVMNNLGLYGTPPNQGEALSSLATLATAPGDNPRWPSASLRRALAWQAAIDDNNPTLRTQLERLFNVQR